MQVLQINHHTFIPLEELQFTATRSSGPGGQHVNKTSTRIVLEFNVQESPNLTDEQKQRIQERIGSRLTKDGVLLVASQVSRSQLFNKQDAIDRFIDMLADALKKQKKRKPTRMSKASKYKRLEAKKRRSAIKKNRGRVEY